KLKYNFIPPDIHNFIKSFFELCGKYIQQAPEFDSNLNPKLRRKRPWIDIHTVKLINEKYQLKKKLKKEPFNLNLINSYKCLITIIKTKIKDCKNNYYQKAIDSAGSDQRKLWQILNEILYRKPRSYTCSINDPNVNYSDPVSLNNFWIGLAEEFFPKICNNFCYINHICKDDQYNYLRDTTLFKESFLRAIEVMKDTKWVSQDNSCPYLFKLSKDVISEALSANIVN